MVLTAARSFGRQIEEGKKVKKSRNRWISASLAAVLLCMSGTTAFADSEEKPYVSLGADLKSDERATVLELLGLSEDDLENCDVATITNADEHEYLDDYLPSSTIGSRALSSVLVERQGEGEGIDVTTKNISYCTVGMYTNALATAGIEDAKVTVAGPFSISGTAGLVGAMKAYETMTGEKIDEENSDAAVEEIVLTSQLGDSIGDKEAAEEVVALAKNEVLKEDLTETGEIREAVEDAADKAGVELSDEDIEKLVELLKKIGKLDLDVNSLQEQAKNLYDQLSDKFGDLDLDVDTGGVWASVKNFFSNLWDSIKGLFS